MQRRDFARIVSTLPLAAALPAAGAARAAAGPAAGAEDRAYWVDVMARLADPVLEALSRDELRRRMPVETKPGREDRRRVAYLEAFGRLMAGMAPWLALGPGTDEEGRRRAHYLDLAVQSLRHAVDPRAADFMLFEEEPQALVDAAFLAHALLRAPEQLFEPLPARDRDNLRQALLATRTLTPYYSNWLLFSAMVEAALQRFWGACDEMRVDYAVRKHMEWYVGDGTYGDGPEYHWDYYNSFVIQPMLLDVLAVFRDRSDAARRRYDAALGRARRYAEVQERLISPEGTFPAVGRSLAYRFGAFQLLGQVALMGALPDALTPGQVRAALTAVIRRMAEAEGTFDDAGWLRIGFCGHQPGIGERYINTGSVYLCSVGLLPLGLPADDAFWTAPAAPWTAQKAWSGDAFPIDKAL